LKRYFLYLILLIFNGYYLKATPKIGENLFHQCKGGRDRHLWGCRLKQGPLQESPDVTQFSLVYKVVYNFPCKGHDPLWGVRAGKAVQRFKRSFDTQTISIEGYGPLEINDLDTRFTRSASLVSSCKLVITAFDYDLSESTKRIIDSKISHINALEALMSSVKALEGLAGTIRTVIAQIRPDILLSLLTRLKEDISSSTDVLPRGNNFVTLKEGLQGVVEKIDNLIEQEPALNDTTLIDRALTVIGSSDRNSSVDSLVSLAIEITNQLAIEIKTLKQESEDILAYASTSTKNEFESRL